MSGGITHFNLSSRNSNHCEYCGWPGSTDWRRQFLLGHCWPSVPPRTTRAKKVPVQDSRTPARPRRPISGKPGNPSARIAVLPATRQMASCRGSSRRPDAAEFGKRGRPLGFQHARSRNYADQPSDRVLPDAREDVMPREMNPSRFACFRCLVVDGEGID